ncbi:MAG: hypothetical protein U0792_14320 [Gemmataceae bacterium]
MTQRSAWKRLKHTQADPRHALPLAFSTLTLLREAHGRVVGIFLDYSKNRIT